MLPIYFFRLDDGSCDRLKSITKNIFDYGASCAKNKSALPIHELIVEGFDDEQVWQVSGNFRICDVVLQSF